MRTSEYAAAVVATPFAFEFAFSGDDFSTAAAFSDTAFAEALAEVPDEDAEMFDGPAPADTEPDPVRVAEEPLPVAFPLPAAEDPAPLPAPGPAPLASR